MTSGEFNSVDCATLQIQGTFISMLYNFLSSLPGLISETLLPKMNIYINMSYVETDIVHFIYCLQ